MEQFLLYALLGIGTGAVYAILAHGVITIYKGSGVLNFGQAAVAMFAAYCYVALIDAGLPTVLAIVVTVLGGALAGAAFAYLVMRPLRNAPVLARVVATLGLFSALSGLVVILWPTVGITKIVAPIFPSEQVSLLGGIIAADRFWLAGVAILLAAGLWALYAFTTFGRATRAVAENERGAALVGFSPDMIAAGNWAIGCGLAALGGVLVAPLTGLDPSVALLIVPVLAAALVGRFTSFGVATAAAFGIGAVQSLVGNYWGSQPGVQDGVPFLVVIVAVVLMGRTIPQRGTGEVERLPLAPTSRIRPLGLAAFVAGTMLLLVVLGPQYQAGIATSLIMAVIALSLVVVTGYVGQISLAQMAFAGVGAFLAARIASELGIPFPLSILVAAIVTVPVGVLIGLPALRVRGINLAVITLGAAVTVSSMVFANDAWTGGYDGSKVPSPSVLGLSLHPVSDPIAFGAFCLIVLLVVIVLVTNVRASPLGRRMLAVRDNERAAAAAGVNVPATKLQAFALSAFICALGGGTLAYQLGTVSYQQFAPMQSITLLTIVFIGGIAAVSGGVVAGVIASGGLVFVLLSTLGAVGNWWVFVSGVIVIVNVMFVPDGVAPLYAELGRKARDRLTGKRDARSPATETEADSVA